MITVIVLMLDAIFVINVPLELVLPPNIFVISAEPNTSIPEIGVSPSSTLTYAYII